MSKGTVVNSWEVKPFVLDEAYSSKMILDDVIAGGKSIQMNEGTLKGGCSTPGAVHTATEVYYIVKGEAILRIDDRKIDVAPGSVVYIPAGTFHGLDNKSQTEDFVLLTFWEDAANNEVYQARVKSWGKSFKRIDEE